MLEFFRKFMKSKLGLAVTLGFVGLLALAFVLADQATNISGGGGGDKVATAGSRKIDSRTLYANAISAVDRARRQNPGANMKEFIAADGLNQMVEQMLDAAAITVWGDDHGLVAGKRLVDSELLKIPGFRGTDGNFSDANFTAMLAQAGMTEKQFREQVADDLVARQVQVPAAFGARVPSDLALRYAQLLTEKREGAIALIPSAAFAPQGEPSAQELANYYQANRNAYMRPERRVIRYATYDDTVITNVPAPTEAQIAERYNAEAEKYKATDARKLTQVIVPTEAAAKVIMGELAKGGTLDAAARSKGLSAAAIASVEKGAYRLQSSAAVADAVFAAKPGAIVGPLKGNLGWFIVRVEGTSGNAGKTLDQARPEIVAALAAENKRHALAEFSAKIEDGFDNGGSLADIAKDLGLTLKQTPPVLADGSIYGTEGQKAPPETTRILQAAFFMEGENQPQLAEIEPGKSFIVFDVSGIQPAAPAPIADVRAQVVADLMLHKGSQGAKAAAEQVLNSVRKGSEMQAAVAALGKALPPVDQVSMGRMQLQAMGRQLPPPVALMFAMARGSVKILPAPKNRGFYVVSVKAITPGTIDPRDPELARARQDFGGLAGREYAEQMRTAIRKDVGVKKVPSVIEAVKRQLLGGN
ncbi:peptidyl-prolyl cis-trans isomerase [Novosphingobium sp. TH158]|uniref:peptidyl-prolyl cis-trans isomerase n=1 Tax=Novosphingobium sp. TH158 TaxID=2067455 RepID=UPI0011817B90|nr:peptidyl-prolyl cis-trans isomerase [Novosphingobium sp. TH158]